jgi:hypothetical protein
VKAARALAKGKRALERKRTSNAIIAARIRYVQGFLDPDAPEGTLPRFEPLRQIAEVVGVTVRTLEEYSRQEGWQDERLAFQAGVVERSKLLATRRLGLQQAAVREEIHAASRVTVRKALEKVKDEELPMVDLARAVQTFDRALEVTERAVNPDLHAGLAPPAAGGGRWLLLREALPVGAPSEVIDVIPEEDSDG